MSKLPKTLEWQSLLRMIMNHWFSCSSSWHSLQGQRRSPVFVCCCFCYRHCWNLHLLKACFELAMRSSQRTLASTMYFHSVTKHVDWDTKTLKEHFFMMKKVLIPVHRCQGLLLRLLLGRKDSPEQQSLVPCLDPRWIIGLGQCLASFSHRLKTFWRIRLVADLAGEEGKKKWHYDEISYVTFQNGLSKFFHYM